MVAAGSLSRVGFGRGLRFVPGVYCKVAFLRACRFEARKISPEWVRKFPFLALLCPLALLEVLWVAGSGPCSLQLPFRFGVAQGAGDGVGSTADPPGPRTPGKMLWSREDLWDSGDTNHPEALLRRKGPLGICSIDPTNNEL